MASLVDVEISDLDKNEQRRRLVRDVFGGVIRDHLVANDIMSDLNGRGVECVRGVASQIRRLHKLRQFSEASQLLIDTLCNSPEPNWYQAFIESLEAHNYRILVALLKDENMPKKDYGQLRKLLNIFTGELERNVRVDDTLLAKCIEKDLILDRHREEIVCDKREMGDTHAVGLLLTYIYRRNVYWFTEFLKVLVEVNHRELAELIGEKEFVSTLVPDEEDGLHERKTRTTSDLPTEDFRIDYVHESNSQLPLMAENRTVEPSFKTEDALQNDVNMDSPDSMTRVKQTLHKNIELEETNAHERVHESNSNELVSQIFAEASDNNGINELHLRGYQQELAEPGVRGMNVIICAPTGSGKTHVAIQICKSHLEENMDGKILFFCNQVALAVQQYKALKQYLHQKIIPLTGDDSEDSPPLIDLLREWDVVILTPQILLDNYKWKDLGNLFDCGISLMVFDECHHTRKKHPYNMIMGLYLDEKHSKGREHAPQIVGLTASLGVGKANQMDKALMHIQKLCANMDCDRICSVKRNVDELRQYVSLPQEDIQRSPGRSPNDPFVQVIQTMMMKIEDHMTEADISALDNPDFERKLVPPSERGSERYTQWANELKSKFVFPLKEHLLRRMFLACIAKLINCNDALIIADSSRAKDALEWLDAEFEKDSRQQFDAVDQWLHHIYKEKHEMLQRHSQVDNNPKLEKLKAMILQAYKERPDSHGIVFVKTRALCFALVSWMMETDGLRELNAGKVVGSNTKDPKTAMTQRQQVDILDYFKEGNHKILIATSVAEEGIDIRKCNIVIRYLHVTNEIAMVQARGRARAADSQYMVLAPEDSGVAQKEAINMMREIMMHKALDIIDQLSEDDFRQKNLEYQEEARTEREIQALILKSQRANRVDKVFQLRCGKCHAFGGLSADIRRIQDVHHVIPDAEFMHNVDTQVHPRPMEYGDFMKIGKIFCKSCHHDWGIQAKYRGILFPVIKVMSFALLDERDSPIGHIKKWKDVPFDVAPFTNDDLKKKVNTLAQDADGTAE